MVLDYPSFKVLVSQMTGIDLRHYKSQQMDRRIQSLMQSWGLSSFEDYLEVLRNNPQRYKEFVKKLTINVSEFFRNPDRFIDLREQIFPELLKSNSNSKIRIWSAGCSDGSEPYSIGIIAKELQAEKRVAIFATDVDHEILARARQGSYAENELKNVPPELLKKYFDLQCQHYYLKEDVKCLVDFQHHNLLTDRYVGDWDLIICRNVVIYFTEEAKRDLYLRFFAALKPGGFLMVGGTEPLLNYKQLGFESFCSSFYRKPEKYIKDNNSNDFRMWR